MLLTSLLRLMPNFQPVNDFSKVWPPNALLMPALNHQRVNGARTSLGTSEKLTGAHHVDDFLIAVSKVRLDAVRINLPQDDA